MSNKLALSSALSVLLMAGFAFCGPHTAAEVGSNPLLLGLSQRAQAELAPAMPRLPGLR